MYVAFLSSLPYSKSELRVFMYEVEGHLPHVGFFHCIYTVPQLASSNCRRIHAHSLQGASQRESSRAEDCTQKKFLPNHIELATERH